MDKHSISLLPISKGQSIYTYDIYQQDMFSNASIKTKLWQNSEKSLKEIEDSKKIKGKIMLAEFPHFLLRLQALRPPFSPFDKSANSRSLINSIICLFA